MASERVGIYQRIKSGEFTVSVELNPVGNNPTAGLVRYARHLQEIGQNIIDINDRPHSSALDITRELLAAEPRVIIFPHIATGNHTKEAVLEGVANSVNGLGLDNFLIVGGDRIDKGQSQIFRPTEAISAISNLKADLDKPIFLAAAFNQNARNLKREGEALRAKVGAGADFFLSQIVLTSDQLNQTADFFHQQTDKPLIIGIWPVTNFATVQRIKSGTISGIELPEEEYLQYHRLRLDQDKLRDLGLRKAKDLIEIARSSGKVQGVYIVAPPNPRDVRKLII